MTDKLNEFGHTFQIKSIASLMANQTFLEQIHDILDESNYDSDGLKWVVKECKKYFDEYRKCITLDVFKVKVSEVENDILKVAIIENLKEITIYTESPDLYFVDMPFDIDLKEIIPEEGSLYMWQSHLLHRVGENLTDDDRMSISFNFGLGDIKKQLKEQDDR